MSTKRKITLCGFMAAALLPGLVLLGFHGRPGNSAASGSNVTPAQNASAGMVTLAFDDGYASAYTNGLPILDAAGLKSTQYIITGSLGQRGYMTREQVVAMQANGHEIGAHTRTHPHLSQVTPAQMKDEIDGSLHDLADIGIHATSFAYPYGDYDDRVVDVVKSAGYGSARTVSSGYDSTDASPLLLKAKMVLPETTATNIKDWINESQAKGTWLILVFHRIDEDGNAMSAGDEMVQAAVDTIVAKKIHVVTVSQGMSILKLKP